MKIIKYILYLLLLISSICCCKTDQTYIYTSNPYHNTLSVIRVYIDKDFVDEYKTEINMAITDWNYALNGSIELLVDDFNFVMTGESLRIAKGGFLILKIDSKNDALKTLYDSSTTLAFANHVGGNIIYVINDRINANMLCGVMRHEIGHLFGAHHQKLLMNSFYHKEYFSCIDKFTMEQVAKIFKLDINKLNYCTWKKTN